MAIESTTAGLAAFTVFGDDVFTSTDLNRHSGEVLNRARVRPVTISRNNEQFALLRRDQAASLIRAVTTMSAVAEIVGEASAMVAGREPAVNLSWLKVFEKDDLQRLLSEILEVTLRAAAATMNGDRAADWDLVQATIHEWRESSLVAQNGVLDHVMYVEPADESVLRDPRDIVKAPETEDTESLCPAK